MEYILEFRGQYNFLSNFFPSNVKMDGIVFPTVEHAYQAAKTLDMGERIKVSKLETPGRAKRYGKRLKLRHDWEIIKLDVMEFLLRQKFSAESDLSKKLVETFPRELAEGNEWGDGFWGIYKDDYGIWCGENHLGEIIMKIRQELVWLT